VQRAYYRRLDLKLTATVLFIAAPLALGGCGLVQQAKMGKAKERLVALRADCRARYPDSHAQMADYSATVGDMANLGAPIPPIAALVAIVVEFFIALAVAFGASTRPLALCLRSTPWEPRSSRTTSGPGMAMSAPRTRSTSTRTSASLAGSSCSMSPVAAGIRWMLA
jgi:hypothetical protein